MKYLSSSAGKDAEFFQWTYDPGNSVGMVKCKCRLLQVS